MPEAEDIVSQISIAVEAGDALRRISEVENAMRRLTVRQNENKDSVQATAAARAQANPEAAAAQSRLLEQLRAQVEAEKTLNNTEAGRQAEARRRAEETARIQQEEIARVQAAAEARRAAEARTAANAESAAVPDTEAEARRRAEIEAGTEAVRERKAAVEETVKIESEAAEKAAASAEAEAQTKENNVRIAKAALQEEKAELASVAAAQEAYRKELELTEARQKLSQMERLHYPKAEIAAQTEEVNRLGIAYHEAAAKESIANEQARIAHMELVQVQAAANSAAREINNYADANRVAAVSSSQMRMQITRSIRGMSSMLSIAGVNSGLGRLVSVSNMVIGLGVPIAATAAAIAGAVAVFAQYRKHAEEAIKASQRFAERAKKDGEEIAKLAGINRSRLDELREYSKKLVLTDSDKIKVKNIVAAINDDFRGLGVTFDETTGKIDGIAAALDRLNRRELILAKNRAQRELSGLTEQAGLQLKDFSKMSGVWEFSGNAARASMLEFARTIYYGLGEMGSQWAKDKNVEIFNSLASTQNKKFAEELAKLPNAAARSVRIRQQLDFLEDRERALNQGGITYKILNSRDEKNRIKALQEALAVSDSIAEKEKKIEEYNRLLKEERLSPTGGMSSKKELDNVQEMLDLRKKEFEVLQKRWRGEERALKQMEVRKEILGRTGIDVWGKYTGKDKEMFDKTLELYRLEMDAYDKERAYERTSSFRADYVRTAAQSTVSADSAEGVRLMSRQFGTNGLADKINKLLEVLTGVKTATEKTADATQGTREAVESGSSLVPASV